MRMAIWSWGLSTFSRAALRRASRNANMRWRSIAISPTLTRPASSLVGRAEETEAHIGEALRLSPRDTMAYTWMYFAGAAKLQLGMWEEAAAWLRRSIEANRNYPHSH